MEEQIREELENRLIDYKKGLITHEIMCFEIAAVFKSLLSSHTTSLLELIEKEKEDMKNPEIYYDKDIDITELPEGLIAEMTGFQKGWAAGLSKVQEIISKFNHK